MPAATIAPITIGNPNAMIMFDESSIIFLYVETTPASAMQRIMLSVSDEMFKALEAERKARKLETVPEAARSILGEYFKMKESR